MDLIVMFCHGVRKPEDPGIARDRVAESIVVGAEAITGQVVRSIANNINVYVRGVVAYAPYIGPGRSWILVVKSRLSSREDLLQHVPLIRGCVNAELETLGLPPAS